MVFSRGLLAFNALVIGLIGILYLYDPNILLGRYSLETGSVGMDNMLRSPYGGLYLGSAGIFLLGALNPRRTRDGVAFLAIFMGGAALGRLASLGLAGAPPPSIMPLLYYECIAVLMALVLWIRSSGQNRSDPAEPIQST